MLVDLTKEELKALAEVSLNESNIELEEVTVEFWTNLHLKLRNISNACTCKEDSNEWRKPDQSNWWIDWRIHCRMWKRGSKTGSYSRLLPSGVCMMQVLTVLSILAICVIIGGVFLLNLYNPH